MDTALSEQGLKIGTNSMIRDEPGNRIRFQVEAFNDENSMEMVLRTIANITWWKSLSYFMLFQGGHGLGHEIRIETKNEIHEAKQILHGPALTAAGMLVLWKGGPIGIGLHVGSLPINAWANRGRRIVFTWEQD